MANSEEKRERRTFIKGFMAGALAITGIAAGAARKGEAANRLEEQGASKDLLYRETPEFRQYYESLRN